MTDLTSNHRSAFTKPSAIRRGVSDQNGASPVPEETATSSASKKSAFLPPSRVPVSSTHVPPSPFESTIRKRVPDTPQKAFSGHSRGGGSEKKLLFSSGKKAKRQASSAALAVSSVSTLNFGSSPVGRTSSRLPLDGVQDSHLSKRQKEEESGSSWGSPPPQLNWSIEATSGEVEDEDRSKLDKNDDFPTYYTLSDRPLLGEGTFGTVKCVRCTTNMQDYALKEITKQVTADYAMREIDLWAQLNHPRIVPLFRAWHENNRAFFLMKLCDRSMGDFCRIWQGLNGGTVDSDLLLLALKDCSSGLEYMHSKGVVHMDIKPNNMYVSEGRVVLGDFGMACRVGSPFPDTDRTYVAPEVFDIHYGCLPSADVFALGMSFLEMGANVRSEEVLSFRESFDFDLFPNLARLHPLLLEYVSQCVERDPRQRPSAAELTRSPVLRGIETSVSRLVLPENYVEPKYQLNRSESVTLWLNSPLQSRSASRSGSPGMNCTSPDELSDRFASSAVVTPRSSNLQLYASPGFGSPRASPLPRASPAPLSIGSSALTSSTPPPPRSNATSPIFPIRRTGSNSNWG